jgi:hypothetical protein
VAFDPKVTTFKQVEKNFVKIDKHLTKLNAFLSRFNWKKVPKNPGGPGEGSNPKPPNWPP